MQRKHLGLAFGLVSAFFLLLVPVATAATRQHRRVDCTWRYAMGANKKTTKMVLTTLVPRTIPGRQKVIRIKYYPHQPKKVFTRNGNRYARFEFRRPARPFILRIHAVVDVYEYDLSVASERKRHNRLGKKERRKYLAHERFLERKNRAIQSVARRIHGRTDVEKIRNIVAFIHSWMRPGTWSPGKKEFGAVGALRKRYGVCCEYADLFVALCRAKKIPARVREGYLTVPVKKGDTPQHDWAEAYIKRYGWVPFDVYHCIGGKMEHVEANRIYLTGTRNDRTINRGHIFYFRYWGTGNIKNEFVVHKQITLAMAGK
jgi:transglutaminase-like putative cysteine protease